MFIVVSVINLAFHSFISDDDSKFYQIYFYVLTEMHGVFLKFQLSVDLLQPRFSKGS